ncbi:hypothetical protein Tco_1412721, partial [Tanacetum coccineum]
NYTFQRDCEESYASSHGKKMPRLLNQYALVLLF